LLLESEADVNAEYLDGTTPLHLAAESGYRDLAELLIANKAKINAQSNDGTTPLHWAAVNGHNDVVMFLLESKAEVNTRSEDGATPMEYAELMGHSDLVELLRRHGGWRRRTDLRYTPSQIRTKDFWWKRWMNLEMNIKVR
jgi:ankyrin repeat protein